MLNVPPTALQTPLRLLRLELQGLGQPGDNAIEYAAWTLTHGHRGGPKPVLE